LYFIFGGKYAIPKRGECQDYKQVQFLEMLSGWIWQEKYFHLFKYDVAVYGQVGSRVIYRKKV